jgi:hypothetical protein
VPAFDCCWHSICLLTKICWRMLQGLVNMNYSCDAKKSCYPSFFRYAHINASGILLCSVCSQIGEASFKHCFASLFQTAIMSMCSRCGWRNHVVHPSTRLALHICRVGQNHIYIYIYIYIFGVHTVFLAWKSPNIRCIYMYIYGSGQPYVFEFCLRGEAKHGAIFWVILHHCSVGIDALVFPVG